MYMNIFIYYSGQRCPSVYSARQRMYLRRNTLHHELQLPDGYGELYIIYTHTPFLLLQ